MLKIKHQFALQKNPNDAYKTKLSVSHLAVSRYLSQRFDGMMMRRKEMVDSASLISGDCAIDMQIEGPSPLNIQQ